MRVPGGAFRRARRALPAAALVTAGALGLVLAAAALVASGERPDGTDSAAGGPQATETFPTVPAPEVRLVHAALHDIAARCQGGADAGALPLLERDVDVILASTRRYRDARFPIDDETGRSLSLLLAARDDLRGCAPTAADRVDRALPPAYRDRADPAG